MSFKPIDAKRDDFRKYLERTGVLEAISKVFIKLIHCSDRPENAIDFICENLGNTLHQNDQIENLQKDLDDSKDEIAQLKQVIESLKTGKNLPEINTANNQEFEQREIPAADYINQHNDFHENQIVLEGKMADVTIVDTKETDVPETVASTEPPEKISIHSEDPPGELSSAGSEEIPDIIDVSESDKEEKLDNFTTADSNKKNVRNKRNDEFLE